MIRFKLVPGLDKVRQEIEYVIRVWAKNQNQQIDFGPGPGNEVVIGRGEGDLFNISPEFINSPTTFAQSSLDPSNAFLIENAFKLLNCTQEFDRTDPDELGRFRFRNSYQFRLKNHTENYVQKLFNKLSLAIGTKPVNQKTKFFLTHDIDLVNGAILEDGFYVLKRGRIDLFLKMLFNVAINKPDWLNIDKIMKIESEYDFKSTFFWLVNKGHATGKHSNADYIINSTTVKKAISSVGEGGWGNGLHKSISDDSFIDEMEKLPVAVNANRYHYLKFNPQNDYQNINDAGLKFDSSLGFAEAIGFRNSYGLPFRPFNIESRVEYGFVECPLHIMDTTYHFYLKENAATLLNDIKKFLEKNESNSIISVLFHNNYISDYKFQDFNKVFRSMLTWLYEMKFECITHDEIIKRYW